jgi:hypothetical protein
MSAGDGADACGWKGAGAAAGLAAEHQRRWQLNRIRGDSHERQQVQSEQSSSWQATVVRISSQSQSRIACTELKRGLFVVLGYGSCC